MTYSGGMKRRLEVARGLLHDPRVLFLDEPTLGLDPQTRLHIWDYLSRLGLTQGVTIFMTTHYLEEADGLCDRIAIIDHGVIKASGSPSQLKEKVGGDVLTIELASGPDITDLLRELPGVSDVVKGDQAYRIKLPRIERALPAIVDGITKKGLEIKPTADAKAGFVVSEKSGNAYYNFTSEGIAEILAEYLNPRLAEIVRDEGSAS